MKNNDAEKSQFRSPIKSKRIVNYIVYMFEFQLIFQNLLLKYEFMRKLHNLLNYSFKF